MYRYLHLESKNIDHITNEFTNTLHLLYRESDFSNEPDLEWLFWDLEEKAARYGSYFMDKEKCLYHEEDIFLEARKTKENYDTYK